MSSRFVSGGTIDSTGEAVKDDAGEAKAASVAPTKNAEWEAVQQELEAERQRREEQHKKAASGEERSLYDILQANKAAKQEAFEEKAKLSNQFRPLDDDEIEFLDEVKQRQRREEEQVRHETEEGLKAFRERQKGDAAGSSRHGATADGEAGGEGEGEGEGKQQWSVGRKRKRIKERGEAMGLKKKSVEEEQKSKARDGNGKVGEGMEKAVEQAGKQSGGTAAPGKKPSLVAYGSDDSDDDDD